jgi:hypothetical protein
VLLFQRYWCFALASTAIAVVYTVDVAGVAAVALLLLLLPVLPLLLLLLLLLPVLPLLLLLLLLLLPVLPLLLLLLLLLLLPLLPLLLLPWGEVEGIMHKLWKFWMTVFIMQDSLGSRKNTQPPSRTLKYRVTFNNLRFPCRKVWKKFSSNLHKKLANRKFSNILITVKQFLFILYKCQLIQILSWLLLMLLAN